VCHVLLSTRDLATHWRSSAQCGVAIVIRSLGKGWRSSGMELFWQVELEPGIDPKVHSLFRFAVYAGADRCKQPELLRDRLSKRGDQEAARRRIRFGLRSIFATEHRGGLMAVRKTGPEGPNTSPTATRRSRGPVDAPGKRHRKPPPQEPLTNGWANREANRWDKKREDWPTRGARLA
jgi:hypothetical protein